MFSSQYEPAGQFSFVVNKISVPLLISRWQYAPAGHAEHELAKSCPLYVPSSHGFGSDDPAGHS